MNILGRALARTPIVQRIREDQKKTEESLAVAKEQQHIASGMGTVIDFYSARQDFWERANHVSQKVAQIIGGGKHANG